MTTVAAAVRDGAAVLAFALELGVLAAAGYWGATRPVSGARRYALAAAGPVLLAVIWGLFGAPTATYPLHGAARIVFEVLWFGTGAAALWVAVRRRPPSSPAAPSVRR